ncbi:MAG: hypothetical protein K8F60_17085 [Melioribacteraceae bacterium]|jgi:hypothetical protein|nr:hypothetical protein [Ignavibacteriota bacterium]MBZ0184176.1 hypothetical protein [Melioribacteraceae bacterium]
MIIFFIFLFHIIFGIYIFVKVLKTESFSSALFNLFLIIILFSVGWAFLNFFTKLFFDQLVYSTHINSESPLWFVLQFAAMWMKKPDGFMFNFTLDKLNLILLTIIEFFFYKNYYKDIIGGGKGK